jgi:RNA polymerase sigma-70 factor (ECF subfamily)
VSDQELLDRLRAGDQAAFDSIFHTHYARLVGVAQGMLRERATAEEIAQEVMLELWRRRETLTVETSLRAYLFRATRNRALNHIRHQRVERRGEPFTSAESSVAAAADSHLAEQEIDAALRRAVEHLPARCREVFELSRVHGLKYAEIARILEISVKTVEAQMGKALRIMRKQLAPWLPENKEM